MKHIFTILFAAMLAGQAWAQTSFEVGNLEYTVTDETNHYVSVGKAETKPTGALNIPEKVTNPDNSVEYSVTSIDSYAFAHCYGLTSVTIPNSVTSIGGYAFYSCSGLTSVTIPNSVTSIGSSAFEGCSGLTSITIPNSVTSIGDWAFRDCSGLTEINVESANTKYTSENGVLFNKDKTTIVCYPAGKAETEYTIPNSVTSIGDDAFYYCSGLTSVTIPNSVTSIGSSAFRGCSSLTSVTIPNSVISIGNYAFCNCSGLTSVTIPNSVTSIGGYAFCNCSGLTSVTIPNSVTSIDYEAFRGCSGLTSVTIPNSVTSIGNNAFRGCSGLTSVTIPNSVTSIEGGAFWGCSGMTEINVESANTKYSSENGVLFDKDKTTIVSYPAGKTETAYTIPYSVTSIDSYAFAHCYGLTSVTIPNSVTSIGSYAFAYCSSLTSVTIPNSVTSIGSFAFAHCYGLTSVTIPNSVTSIGGYAFRDCSGLTSVTIPKSVTCIGDDAFDGCRGLKQITCYATYENGLPTLGEDVFDNNSCTVTVPCGQTDYYKESDWGKYSNFTFVEDYLYEFTAEANNPEMGSIEILQMPDCSNKWATVKATANEGYVFVMWDDKSTNEENSNVHVSGDRHCIAYFAPADADINIIPKNYNIAFWYYNSNTKMLHIGGHGELSIEIDYMWGDLPKAEVEHVFIEDGFTYINSSTFQNFKALKDVRLPATLKKVGDYSFNGCESLESVVIPEGVTEIEYAAFNGCSSMKYAVLPSTLQKMWSRAFGSCSMLDSIVVKCDTAIDLPSMVFYGGSINTKFYIPCGKKTLYTSKECWTINVTSNDNFVETMVYDLSVATSDSERGTAAITQAPECGTNAIVTATAKPNYQFLKWSNGSTANPYEFALEKDLSLTAIFVGKQSEITVKADTNGTVIVPQYAYFEDSVEVKISPKLGYEIDKLTITADGEKLELKNNKFMMPLTNVNISATFKQIDYQITTEAENGKIIVGQTAHYGDTVMFNINSDNGYKFLSVSVKDTADKNIRLVGDNSFIMPAANVTITAIFEKEDHTPVAETAANAVSIYAHGNTIVVENTTDEISVYDAMGHLVGRDAIHRVRAELQVNTAGLYIVKVGNVAKRVMVMNNQQ